MVVQQNVKDFVIQELSYQRFANHGVAHINFEHRSRWSRHIAGIGRQTRNKEFAPMRIEAGS